MLVLASSSPFDESLKALQTLAQQQQSRRPENSLTALNQILFSLDQSTRGRFGEINPNLDQEVYVVDPNKLAALSLTFQSVANFFTD